MRYLSERHGLRRFETVDEILNMAFLKTILPRMAEEAEQGGERYQIFYEVKSNLKREQNRGPTPDELAKIHEEVGDYYERTSHAYHLTSELRDDGLIDPVDTRNTLAMALSASLNAPIERTPGGVLRI
ncbi:MAG: hypothetical protein GY944_12410 [bacterium]|nr:hypothetical protein [bacterium]